MQKNRLEAFSDGVIAIIITIMVLELKIPHEPDIYELFHIFPKFLSYVLSFLYLAIYWNNHHHLLHTVHRVNGKILWANIHLLFWLSLIPFATAWSGENNFAADPVIVYGFILFMSGLSYFILSKTIISSHGKDSILASAIGKDFKGTLSVILYAVSTPLAYWEPGISMGVYTLVAIMWLIPDKRIEKELSRTVE
ncbi:MAG: DUF1211 domain-containing protein [Ignavibacteriales bacterium]|nr:DUF1211 domain-containing protein [Ignavibacteriales bacterium]